MADLGDVTALLASMAVGAVYPTGTGSPSVGGLGVGVKVFEGWPLPASLDSDITAGNAQVSVYPMGASGSAIFQVLDEQYLVTPAVHGMTAVVSNTKVTLAGAPGASEYATVVADGRYTFTAAGASIPAILSAIAASAAANYPSVSVAGASITFPGSKKLACHIGAPATAAIVTHRQRQPVMVSVWAPNPALRNTLASAVAAALKKVNRLTFPDNSQGVMGFSHEVQHDDRQTASIYRRDLIFNVEYATLDQYQVFEITTFNPTIDSGPSIYGRVATTTIAGG